MFKVDQKVVAIENGTITNLKKDEIYSVLAVNQCSCGHQSISVNGLRRKLKKNPTTRCSCGMIFFNNGLVYLSSRFFRPLDHQFGEDICAMISEQVKEELISI